MSPLAEQLFSKIKHPRSGYSLLSAADKLGYTRINHRRVRLISADFFAAVSELEGERLIRVRYWPSQPRDFVIQLTLKGKIEQAKRQRAGAA